MRNKLFLFLIIVLAFLGVVDSLHLLEIKYGGKASLNCDLSETFSCSSVNQSHWSAFSGFPTAGIGLMGYLLLGLMSITLMYEEVLVKKKYFRDLFDWQVTPLTLMVTAFLGLLVQLYYTYVEFFLLEQFCVFCLFSQALIIGIAVFAFLNWKNSG